MEEPTQITKANKEDIVNVSPCAVGLLVVVIIVYVHKNNFSCRYIFGNSNSTVCVYITYDVNI